MIPYGRQHISEEDIQAVVDVLRSDYLTQGPAVPKFEQAVCDYTGAKYGVAVNSATSALHIACRSLDIGEGDWLWTTPITFVASANCGLYCGAKIDFVDIDPHTWNLSVDRLKEKLEQAKQDNRLPKVLVAVHLCGLPCDMDTIFKLSQEYGFKIIEDASHAIGGRYKNLPVGNCRHSDITVFSFHPVKTMTTAEGGMAVTNSKVLAAKMALLRCHGITRDPTQMTHDPDGAWYYQQVDLGYNYRMTDIQAVLGSSQLRRLDEFVAKRHEIANKYDKKLQQLPLGLPHRCVDRYSGLHLYVMRLQLNQHHKTHKQIFDFLRATGIGVNLHYIPVHTQPYYKELGFQEGDFPDAESYYAEAISLPMFFDLTDAQIEEVVAAVKLSMQ